MVAPRFFFVFVLLLVCLEYIYAAPNPNALSLGERQDLAQRFVEFLHEDKELSRVLEQVEWNDADHLVRNKRQTTSTTNDEFDNPQEKPGFFDRAAKFVTELLQRFLKWVNNSDNN